jgi:hypothetical protein
MAEAKKKEKNMVFIDIGKVSFFKPNAAAELEQEYLIVPEAAAKFLKASYKKLPPSPITVRPKRGKPYTKEISSNRSGARYKFGYVDKIITVGTKKKVKMKWISFYIPNGAKLRSYLEAALKKIGNKPIRLKTPANKTCQIASVK